MKYLQSIFAQFDLILMFILGVSLLLVVGDIIYAADITVGHSNVFQPANKDDLVRKLDEGGYYHAYSDTACGDINDWDTHLVIDMSDLFFGKVLFDCDISNWDVSNVSTMKGMFVGAVRFNHDIGGWDVSNVTDMSSMFEGAIYFNQDISHWHVSEVKTMNAMFFEARSFNVDLSRWDICQGTDMDYMFLDAVNFNQDLNWDGSNIGLLN